MNRKKLLSLLKRREGEKLDYKLKIDLTMESGKKELSKDICAIANSRGGRGHLVIGVEDKTQKVVGMDKNSITEEQIQQIISSRCEPPVPISLDFIKIYGKDVAVITIYQSHQKPHQTRDNGAFYIRRGSTTDTMRKQELITAFQENMSLNIELTPVVNSSINDLDISLVDKYFKNHNIITNNENRNILMENSKIICIDNEEKRYYATLGGLLVFSKRNYIYAPNNMIKVVNKLNRKKDEIFIIQGDLLTMLEKSNDIIKEILPEDYPTYAVYEGIKNAVLYRDYTIINKEIEIIIKNNSLEIISPGVIIKNNKSTQNLSHNYIKRNMWIYEKIITIDNKKIFLQSGRGFSKMKKAFKDIGKVKFINSLKDNSFKVIYPGVDSLQNNNGKI